MSAKRRHIEQSPTPCVAATCCRERARRGSKSRLQQRLDVEEGEGDFAVSIALTKERDLKGNSEEFKEALSPDRAGLWRVGLETGDPLARTGKAGRPVCRGACLAANNWHYYIVSYKKIVPLAPQIIDFCRQCGVVDSREDQPSQPRLAVPRLRVPRC